MRQLAQRTSRDWHRAEQTADSARIEGQDLEIELRGAWATPAAEYILALNPDVGSALAELLWLLSLPDSAGDRAANQAARLSALIQRGVPRRT